MVKIVPSGLWRISRIIEYICRFRYAEDGQRISDAFVIAVAGTFKPV